MGEINVFSSKHSKVPSIVVSLIIVISSKALSADAGYISSRNCQIYRSPDLYQPVCGSDERTYDNAMYLDCLRSNRETTAIMRKSGRCVVARDACEENLYYNPVCGTDERTWPNREALACYNQRNNIVVEVRSQGECEERDYCDSDGFMEFSANPVCANDGRTYRNIEEVRCLRRENPELAVVSNGGCSADYVRKVYGSRRPEICQIAASRREWNPVCGSDRRTYPNAYEMLCSQPDLSVYGNCQCGECDTDACAGARDYETCLDSGECSNSEDEVCGSDGVTYLSANHVACRRKSDRYLRVAHTGSCVEEDDPCDTVYMRRPVCGTDGRNYLSPEAIWCKNRRSQRKAVTYFHDGSCLGRSMIRAF